MAAALEDTLFLSSSFFPFPFPFRCLFDPFPFLSFDDFGDVLSVVSALSVYPPTSPWLYRTSTQRKLDWGGGLAIEYIREDDEEFPATRALDETEVFDFTPRRSFIEPERLVDGEGERRREEEGIGERER